jgi:hypothetical protein
MTRRLLRERDDERWDETELLNIWVNESDKDVEGSSSQGCIGEEDVDTSDADSDSVVEAYLLGRQLQSRPVRRLVRYPTLRFSSETLPIYSPSVPASVTLHAPSRFRHMSFSWPSYGPYGRDPYNFTFPSSSTGSSTALSIWPSPILFPLQPQPTTQHADAGHPIPPHLISSHGREQAESLETSDNMSMSESSDSVD